MSYKSLAMVLLCVGVALCQMDKEMMEMAKMLHAQCVESTGATEDMIMNANKGVFVDNDNLKCYMKCILVNIGGMDEDGKVHPDAIVAVLPPNIRATALPMITNCAKEVGANVCDKAFNVNKCFYKSDPKTYILV